MNDRTSMARGDLRLVAGDGGLHRLCLIMAVHRTWAEVALVHPYVERATAADVAVAGRLAGTRYDVVVQSDLRGVVWNDQVCRGLVGELTGDTLLEANRLLASDVAAADGLHVGARLVGPFDARWPFKTSEGADLDRLTRACTTRLLAAPSPDARPATTRPICCGMPQPDQETCHVDRDAVPHRHC